MPSLRLWLPGCCPNQSRAQSPTAVYLGSWVFMSLLGGIHTTERAAGRAGNLDSPASEAMAVPFSAFSGLAQGAGMATGQPQGEGTSPALSSGPRAIYVTLSGPPAQLCQSCPPGPQNYCVTLGDLTPAKLTASPFLWALGLSLSHWVTSHYQNPQLGLFPTEWPHRRALGHCSQAWE